MKKMIIVLTVLLFAVPILGADFEIYGKLGMAGWWMNTDRFYRDTVDKLIDTVISQNDTTYDTTDIFGTDTIPVRTNIIEPIGKLGFKFTGDRVGACVEIDAILNLYDSELNGIGVLSDYKKRSYFARLRKFYAEWYINDYVTFLAGQTYTPTSFISASNQAFDGGTNLLNAGCLYTGRIPMLQLSFGNQLGAELDEISGFKWEGKIAAVRIDTSAMWYRNIHPSKKVKYSCKTSMPKIEGSFGVNLENDFIAFNGQVAGGYMKYQSVIYDIKTVADSGELDIEAWVVGGDFGVKIGPVKIVYDIFYGQNIGSYGVWVGDRFGWWRIADYMLPFFSVDVAVGDGDSVMNGRALEMAVVLNYKPVNIISFEAGVGGIIGYHDHDEYADRWARVFGEFGTIAWYVQTEIEIFEHLTVTPEVGQYIYGPFLGFGKYIYGGFNTLIEF